MLNLKQKFTAAGAEPAGKREDTANIKRQQTIDALDRRIKEDPILSKIIGKGGIGRPWTMREHTQIHSLHDSHCFALLMTLFGMVKGWDVSNWLPGAIDREIRRQTAFQTFNGI